MSDKKSGSDNLIAQAGILAAAGIISRIIGLLYRSPMHAVIGDLGFGYYNSAYNYYTIVLLISSYSIPSAISKVIAQKLAVREYRNAHRVFLCALGYVLVVGSAASLFLFFGAGLFVSEEAVPVLRTFAPTVFLFGILGVLRGYFQAHKSMVQTSVSQILEQVVNAVVSVGAAYLLTRGAAGSLGTPADEAEQVDRAVHGAVGSALGTGAGVLAALLFMLGMYALNKNIIYGRIRRDRHTNVESYRNILKTITMVVTPFILSTAVYNLSSTVNNNIYTDKFPAIRGISSVEIYTRWSAFSQALTISNIPIAFATAIAAAVLPSVAQLVAARDGKKTRETIALAVKMTMLISIPCAVGLFVLAKPITALLFPANTKETEDLAAALLMVLALSVVFYALSTLNSQILQGLGKLNMPIVNAGIALAVQTAVSVGLLFLTSLELYSIAIANTVYSGVMFFLNQRAVRRAAGYRQEVTRTFLVPTLAAGLMGAAARAVYEAMLLVTKSPRISVVAAVPLGACVYFAMLLLFRGVTEEELRRFPKGYLLVRLAKRMRLLR